MTRNPFLQEAHFTQQVIDLAHTLGLRVAHFRPGRMKDRDGKEVWRTPVAGDGKGWPDLVIVGRRGILHRELKLEGKYPTKDQRVWLELLNRAGADVGVWRPQDMDDLTIRNELMRIR